MADHHKKQSPREQSINPKHITATIILHIQIRRVWNVGNVLEFIIKEFMSIRNLSILSFQRRESGKGTLFGVERIEEINASHSVANGMLWVSIVEITFDSKAIFVLM